MTDVEHRPTPWWAELAFILGTGIDLFAIVATGKLLSDQFGAGSPWLFAASYAVPGAIGFAAFWLVCRRIRPRL